MYNTLPVFFFFLLIYNEYCLQYAHSCLPRIAKGGHCLTRSFLAEEKKYKAHLRNLGKTKFVLRIMHFSSLKKFFRVCYAHKIVLFQKLLWRVDVFLQYNHKLVRTFLFLKNHLTMTSLSDKMWCIQSGMSEVLMRPAMLHYSLTGQQRVIFPSLGCSVSSPSRLHGHPLSGTSLGFSETVKESDKVIK